MATSFSQNVRTTTSIMNISDLRAGMDWVELQGKITQVPRPLDQNETNPLAVLRLVIEENDSKQGWKVVLDKVKATEFSLEDGTGCVWVMPEQLDLNLMGDGTFASIHQAEEALKTLGMQPNSAWGRGLRYRIWELRGGQTLVAVGKLHQRFTLSSDENQSLILSPADKPVSQTTTPPATSTWRRQWLLLLLLGLGAGGLLAGFLGLLWVLTR